MTGDFNPFPGDFGNFISHGDVLLGVGDFLPGVGDFLPNRGEDGYCIVLLSTPSSSSRVPSAIIVRKQ